MLVVAKNRSEPQMNTQKSLFLMVAFFGMAIGTYFLISPYEQCKREQTAKFRGQDTTAMGASTLDLTKVICARITNW